MPRQLRSGKAREFATARIGLPLWRARIDPYGHAHIEVGHDFHQPLRFPGHFYDPELGLHYNRFRYYDPALCRYLETDPWGLKGGINLYAYTSNPLVQVDVRGLACPKAGAAEGAAEPEQRPDQEGEPEALRQAVRDMQASGSVDAETLRHMVREAGGDTSMLGSGPRVVRNEDGVPTHAVVSHGPRAGEHVQIRNGRRAGETVNGVPFDNNGFPVFHSHYDTTLGSEHLGTGDDNAHFAAANGALADDLRRNPALADELGLSGQQVDHILREPPSSDPPRGMTWHHHQDEGRMQLVQRDEHAAVGHTGGSSIWGGRRREPRESQQ